MPQHPAGDDTVRLQPDGTVGSARPTPPAAPPPAAVPSAGPTAPGADPMSARSQSDTQAIPPVDEPASSDTRAIPPVDEPASSDTPAIPPAQSGTQVVDLSTAPDGALATEQTGSGEPPERHDATGGRPRWRRPAVLVPAAAVLALGVAYGADLLFAGDDVPRGTVVAGIELGGLSPAAAAERLDSQLTARVTADRTVVAADVQGVLHPPAAGISLDVPATVDAVDDQPLNPWTRLTSLFSDRPVDPVLTSDRTSLDAQVEQLAATVDRAPVDATITLTGTTPSLVAPVEGRNLDRAGAAEAITAALASGADPATPIELPVDVTEVRVDSAEAQRVLDATVAPALAAPVTVVGSDGAESVDVPPSAIAASLTFTPQDDGSLAVAVDPAALQAAVGDGFAGFGSPAQDARFQVSGESISVVPSVDGQGINPTDLADQLLPVLDDPAPRSVTATLGPVPAAFTTEQAQSLGIKEKVSSFTTSFTSTASGTNIRVVAAEVDGAIVEPGDTFSLNGYTGPRGTAQGYVPAAVISGGEISQAVGGGISQFATTMFNAVFFGGLEDVTHKPHSFYISRYPAGREATVYEGVIDLQWRNDSDTGIYVQTEWVPGSITVTFWGTKRYEIESISSERRNIRQPAVQQKVDDGNCTSQSGSLGFDITVTRVFKDLDTGAELRREDFDTHYAAEAVIRCVPPAAPAPAAPAPADQPAPATTAPAAPATPSGRRPGARVPAGAGAQGRRPRR
jgi:vancomycin resistance protein YoaR